MEQIVLYGDYLGTFIFALTGGLAAAEKRLDLGGFFLLAFVTGVGGGTTRDVLLNRDSIFWIESPNYIFICLVGALITFFWAASFQRLHKALVWSDALGLAIFSVIGAGIALREGAAPIVAVLMGAVTATGGGVIREVLRNELPIVFHREIYISAAVAGGATLVGLYHLGMNPWVAVIIGFLAAFALRAWGIAYDKHLPVYKPRSRNGPSG